MVGANGSLKNILIASYAQLLGRLERRLGSTDLAQEALHDTYVRLERGDDIESVKHPFAYLLRIAVNIAHDHRRKANRLATFDEIETAFNLVDEYPDPEHVTQARSDVEAVRRAMMQMPARRREILLASFQENLTSRAIAARFGLSTRTVDAELRAARDHCAKILSDREKR